MEGARREQQTGGNGRGRSAESPTDIPKRGWRDVVLRVKERISKDNVSIVAAGTAFYLLLGLVPGLAAVISIYGLIANPADVTAQFDALARVIPGDVRTLLEGQMTRLAGQHQTAGIAALVSIVLALWGCGAAMKTVMNALNIIYHEEEKRGYVRLTLAALGLTLAFVLTVVVVVAIIVGLPALLQHLGLGNTARTALQILRWPFLLLVGLCGLAVLYRYGPSREKPRWEWVSPGAVSATVLWVIVSALFGFYAGHFGSYNKTYGSLGAIIVLMMWLYLSAFALLVGADINAEAEHQTARDTTTGPPEPRGRRGAYVADTLGRKP